MKILLVHSDKRLAARESIDLWRIIRPFRELSKHVDWQIDHRDYLLDTELFEEGGKYPTEELVKQLIELGSYDIVWCGYFPDASLFDCMKFVEIKYGTRFVVDMDDDIYHLPKNNSFWRDGGLDGVRDVKWMLKNASHVVTSTPVLQAEFAKHRDGPTHLLPNYIGNDFKHPKFDNKEQIVIGYFGSVTHKVDLADSGFREALKLIMDKYKNVYMQTVGVGIGTYMPKGRYLHSNGSPGQAWIDEVWPRINCDIAVAPLIDNEFNRGRSNIKWLEASFIPSALIASNVTPYKECIDNGNNGILVNNDTESWYEALEVLVTQPKLRTRLATTAQSKVKADWSIENNWRVLKDIVELISKN